MKRLLLFSTIAFTSCVLMFPDNLTNNAFYNIDDTSIRLVIKYDTDTLYKTNYDHTYNLRGTQYNLLSTTNSIDTTHRIGIQIKLWAEIILNEEGTFYRRYPANGLLDKINTISICFTNENSSFDITPFLKGDSSIYEIK